MWWKMSEPLETLGQGVKKNELLDQHVYRRSCTHTPIARGQVVGKELTCSASCLRAIDAGGLGGGGNQTAGRSSTVIVFVAPGDDVLCVTFFTEKHVALLLARWIRKAS